MYNIQKIDKNEKKIAFVKLRKLIMQALVFLKISYPALVVLAASNGLLSLVGEAPFVRNQQKQYLYTIQTIDSLGNEEVTNKYSSDDLLGNSTIKHYTKWGKVDNHYEREIKEYKLKKIDNYFIEKTINDTKTIEKLEDLFGKPSSTEIEYKDNLTKEELNSNGHIEAKLYNVDESKYIEIDEKVTDCISRSIATLALEILTIISVYLMREMLGGYNLYDVERDLKNAKSKCDYEIRRIKEK